MTKDEKYMRIAIKEAQKAVILDEVPVGAIVVKDVPPYSIVGGVPAHVLKNRKAN